VKADQIPNRSGKALYIRRLATGLSLVLLTGYTVACTSGIVPVPSPTGGRISVPGPATGGIGALTLSSPAVFPPTSLGSFNPATATSPVGAATSTPPNSPSGPRTASVNTTPSKRPTTPRMTFRSPLPPSCAAQVLASLTDQQKIGQLLMVGLPAESAFSWPSSLPPLPIGGVFLAGRSTADAATLAVDIAAVQQTAGQVSGVPAHIAVDQEGGSVQSLRGPDFPPLPSAVEQGQQSPAVLALTTATWSAKLVQAGITLDLAPVADTVPAGTALQNPPIGREDRQYGSTPAGVADSVTTVVAAMSRAGLGSTLKHFPGLGRVTANTDIETGAVDEATTVSDFSLLPFKSGIAAKATAVMISSASYPQLDPDNIAVFSPAIITGLLRQDLHFAGLVVSDDLGGAVAVSTVPIGRRAVDFVAAGGDMVLTVQPTDVSLMTVALTAKAAQSPSFRQRVENAALHVLQSKQSLRMLACQ